MSVSYVHTTYVHKYFRTSANRTPKCIVETSSISCFVPLSLCIPSILPYFLIFRFFLYNEFSIMSFFIMSFAVFFLSYFVASLCFFNSFRRSFVLSFDLRRLFGAHLWRAFSLYVFHCLLIPLHVRSFDFILLVYVEAGRIGSASKRDTVSQYLDHGSRDLSLLQAEDSIDGPLQRLASFPQRQIDRDIAASGGPAAALSLGSSRFRLRGATKFVFVLVRSALRYDYGQLRFVSRVSRRDLSFSCNRYSRSLVSFVAVCLAEI